VKNTAAGAAPPPAGHPGSGIRALGPRGKLLWLLFFVVVALSAKATVDVVRYSRRYLPVWFAPIMAVLVTAFVLVTGWAVLGTARAWTAQRDEPSRSKSTARSMAVLPWGALLLSFVCTTSVHHFAPFRMSPLRWPSLITDFSLAPMMTFNCILVLTAFFATTVLAVLYIRGRIEFAERGLVLVGFALLVPNDSCGNPFNWWWNKRLGGSPLMFVPVVVAILLGQAALAGVRPRTHVVAMALLCVFVTLLGLGHMTRVIW
jgi:hypothetical protein